MIQWNKHTQSTLGLFMIVVIMIFLWTNHKSPSMVESVNSEHASSTESVIKNEIDEEKLMEAIKIIESEKPLGITGNETVEEIHNNPYVTHIRKALNNYLDGSNVGAEEVIALEEVSSSTSDCGLSRFHKEYYQSKFFVYDVSDSEMGGVQVWVVFVNKPDSIFWAWVYQLDSGEYSLRGFCRVGPTDGRKIEFTELMNSFIHSDKFEYSI